jgi:hypothetical protein
VRIAGDGARFESGETLPTRWGNAFSTLSITIAIPICMAMYAHNSRTTEGKTEMEELI